MGRAERRAVHVHHVGAPIGESPGQLDLERVAREIVYDDPVGGFTSDVAGYGRGAIEELLQAAEQRGSLTAPEIAEILDTRELPVAYETEIAVGDGGE